MKQIAQYQDGRLELQETPMPAAPPGGILVRTTHSVISIGTEKMKVEQARMNLLQKARARPDQVRKVLDTARNLGLKAAMQKVRNRLETPSPLGYSAAGIVVGVDPANTRFSVGDRVACAGAECAFHAEYIALPDFLAAPIPEGVASWQAAYTTVCAIALQAVRQTEPTLGSRVIVMGQGLIGLLVTALLKANGVRVMAVDVQRSRREMATLMGAERVVIHGEQTLADEVRTWTAGHGVDAVVLCTGTSSNTPVEQAAESLRDRGRLVDVGITKLDLPWKTFYEKELDVRFSRSYGPGRYDPEYEWGGHDYPLGYVRWTEQRNFEACLHLMATGGINLAALTTRRVSFSQALETYGSLMESGSTDIGVVLEYEGGARSEIAALSVARSEIAALPVARSEIAALPVARSEIAALSVARSEIAALPVARSEIAAPPGGGQPSVLSPPVRKLDVIGAGNFARTMLLPHLRGKIVFGTVVNQTALSARHVREKFGFEKAETDASLLDADGDGNATLIATRHHLHAPLVIQALKKHRHVFVEKPLCLTVAELSEIAAVSAVSRGTLQVGFNRRFAPASQSLKRELEMISGPKSISYRVVAGRVDATSWYANYQESGGRLLGEACHFFDYFRFLIGAEPKSVFCQNIGRPSGRIDFPDSISAQVEFLDGSSAQLIYSAEGDSSFPKESLTVFAPGIVAEVVNFQKLTVHRGRKSRTTSFGSKGHAEQMMAWLAFLRGEARHPLALESSLRTMALTFAALESIRRGTAVGMDDPEFLEMKR